MAKSKGSRWTPQNPYWAEDLPARAAPEQVTPGLFGDLNAIDDTMLEISRASSIMTGIVLFFVSIGGGTLLILFFYILIATYRSPDIGFNFAIIFSLTLIIFTVIGFVLLARVEFMIPRDRPIRFNRKIKKIYVYESSWSLNPLQSPQVTIKTFHWDTIGAELTRQRGFNGKAYIERWALGLVSCRPGTNEVVDRFELKGNRVTTAELYRMWEYCRHYMEKGRDGLPEYAPRNQEISFRRSFFKYMDFCDPTEEGRQLRSAMTFSDWAFNLPLGILFFWAFFPMGIGHYIVSRFAPEVKWPPALDAESRGLSISGSDEENPTDVASDN